MEKRKIEITKVNRPPLTQKARSAIELYVQLKADYHYLGIAVNLTLQADRMLRKELYSYLKYKGYRWRTGYGYGKGQWVKK